MAAPAGAETDEERAAQLAAEAKTIGGDGDLPGAVELLRRAIALDDTPDYRCNLAVAHYHLQAYAVAHLLLGMCLEHTDQHDDPKFAREAPTAYAYAGKVLAAGGHGSVAFRTIPPDARIAVSAFDPRERFLAPRTVWLPVGTHTITVSTPGYKTITRTIEVIEGDNTIDPIELEPDPEPPPAGGDDDDDGGGGSGSGLDDDDDLGGGDGGGAGTPIGTEPRDGGSGAPSRRGAYIWLGVGGASLIGGAVFHALAIGTVSELADLPDGTERNDKIDELNLQRGLMGGLYVVGGVAVGVGIYRWITAKPPSSGVEVGAAPSADGSGGMVWFHWRR